LTAAPYLYTLWGYLTDIAESRPAMSHAHHHHDHAPAAETAIDPVCGMTVKLGIGKPSFDYRGTTYHFCSQGCRTKFEADPERYLAAKPAAGGHSHHHHGHTPAPAKAPPPAPKGTLYTCPMHPEI